jgi:hypothetical protein
MSNMPKIIGFAHMLLLSSKEEVWKRKKGEQIKSLGGDKK